MNKLWLVVAMLFLGVSMLFLGGVAMYRSLKVADYVCYYGDTKQKLSTSQWIGNAPNQQFINGSWVRFDDVKCIETSEKDFSCPSDAVFNYSGGQKFVGYQLVTKGDLAPFVVHNVTKI